MKELKINILNILLKKKQTPKTLTAQQLSQKKIK